MEVFLTFQIWGLHLYIVNQNFHIIAANTFLDFREKCLTSLDDIDLSLFSAI